MGAPEWGEVKAVLDDPNISEDKKRAVMEAYGAHNFSLNDEQEKYADRYDVSEGWDYVPIGSTADPLRDAVNEAKAEGESKSYNSREQTKAVNEGQTKLDGMQAPTASGSGVKHSDELFDAGKAGLKVFEKFIPIWNNRPGDSVGNTHSLDYGKDIETPYNEQRGINFHKFLMEADEFSSAKGTVEEMKKSADGQLNSLYGQWEGKAATASHDHYSNKIAPKITEMADGLGGAADLTRTAVSGVFTLCKSKADEVLGMYREQVGQADTFMAEKVVSLARGEGDFSKDRVREVAGWVDSKTGSNLADRIEDDDFCLNDQNKTFAIDQCKKWIRDSFNKEFWGIYEQFKKCNESTKTAVDGKWDVLSAYMADFENPFPAPASTEQPGDGKDKNGGGTPPGGGGTPPGGGGTPPGGGGTPPGGGGTPPNVEMPKPENPLDKDGDGKPDDLKVPGDTDGDGKPDDLDGDGKPDGLKGEEEAPETVTIKSGDNEIKITEPDSRGHVQITVDTPTSEPKTYDVDFSNNPDAAKALMGQNGAAALAGALSGATAASTGSAGTPISATAPAGGPTAGGADGAIPIEAGADGKALIELDGLAITAEVDPLTGEISLSVDNGDGSPEQYGVEFGEDEPADSGLEDDGLKLPESDFQQAVPPDVTTLPAEGVGMTEPGGFIDPSEMVTLPAEGGVAEPAFATMPAEGGAVGAPAQGFTEPGFAPAGVEQPVFTQPAPAGTFDAGFAQPVSADSGGTTTAQGASIFGGSSGGGFDGADSVLGGGSSSSDSAWGNSSSNGDQQQGLADTNASQAGQAGSATLPSMQDGAGHSQTSGSPMGGGMMGGAPMGGGQQGGGNSGDSERGASQWRTTGSLFDDDAALSRLQGVLGEDGPR